MRNWLLGLLGRGSDRVTTLRGVSDRLQEIEKRLDEYELERHEWYGRMQRVLARINKAAKRAETARVEPEEDEANGVPPMSEFELLNRFRR